MIKNNLEVNIGENTPAKTVAASKILPWFILACWSVLVRLDQLYLPLNRDSGLFAYGGWRILHGALPYTGFFDNKLPGVFYINALAISIFGPSKVGIWLFGTIYAVLTIWAFYTVARKVCRKYLAIAASMVFIFYYCNYGLCDDGNYSECYVALPMLLAVVAIMRWSEKREGLFLPLLAGVLGAVAVIIKQPAFSVIIACGLFASFGSKRTKVSSGLIVLLGAALLSGMLIIWMSAVGILKEAYQANVVFNRLYLKDAIGNGWECSRLSMLLGLNMIALPMVGAVFALFTRTASKCRVNGIAWLLVPWFLFDLVGLAMGGRFCNHYFLTILPSSMLLLALFVESLKPRGWKLAGWVGLAIALMVGPVWWIEDANPNDTTALGGSIIERQGHAYWWIKEKRFNEGARFNFEQAADWITQHTTEKDTIYTWGWCTRIAFLSNREICSRYLHAHPLGATGFDRDKRIAELAHDIETRRPKYIIDENLIMPSTAPPLGKGIVMKSVSPFFRLDGYGPVQRIVARDYRLVANVAGYLMYERKVDGR